MNSRLTPYHKPLPKDLPGFEVEQAVARMMDSAELWWQALAIFHSHYENWEDAWRQSQSAADAERKCVHALRSSAGNVGADRLAVAAAALEDALIAGNLPPELLISLRAHLLERFTEVRQSSAVALMVSIPV